MREYEQRGQPNEEADCDSNCRCLVAIVIYYIRAITAYRGYFLLPNTKIIQKNVTLFRLRS